MPTATVELALISDDPDAPTPEPWVHWVLYGLSPGAAELPPGSAGGGVEGRNSWRTSGYKGPMPPPGDGVHRYRFRLYALDAALRLAGGMTKDRLLRAMEGHVLDYGELVGTYERQSVSGIENTTGRERGPWPGGSGTEFVGDRVGEIRRQPVWFRHRVQQVRSQATRPAGRSP